MAYDTFQNADTILSGQSVSAGVQINGLHPIRLIMPAAWDAAAITLQESFDNGVLSPWQNIYDEAGGELTLIVAAARNVRIPVTFLPAGQWIRIRSGTSATPVNQTASRILTWWAKKYGGTN